MPPALSRKNRVWQARSIPVVTRCYIYDILTHFHDICKCFFTHLILNDEKAQNSLLKAIEH